MGEPPESQLPQSLMRLGHKHKKTKRQKKEKEDEEASPGSRDMDEDKDVSINSYPAGKDIPTMGDEPNDNETDFAQPPKKKKTKKERKKNKRQQHDEEEHEQVSIGSRDMDEDADIAVDSYAPAGRDSPTMGDEPHDDETGFTEPPKKKKKMKKKKEKERQQDDEVEIENAELQEDNIASTRNQEMPVNDCDPHSVAASVSSSGASSQCYLCGTHIRSDKKYIQHLGKKHNIRSYQCPRCHRGNSSKKQLFIHMKVACTGLTPLGPKFCCLYCPIVYARKKDLSRHCRTHHGEGNEKLFHCPRCTKAFTRRSSVHNHLPSCEKGMLSASKEKMPVVCDDCGKEYASRNSLAYHIRTVHKNVTYTCACRRQFRWSTDYYAHRKICPKVAHS